MILNIRLAKIKENSTILFTILIILWIAMMYFFPEKMSSLFTTFLGNIILLAMTVCISMNNAIHGLLFVFVCMLLYYYYYAINYHNKEMFQPNSLYNDSLSPESIRKYLQMQVTLNRNTNFDIEKLKQQATQEELDSFLKNGKWPWNDHVIQLYEDMLNKNVYIRNTPMESLLEVQTIYNQTAILDLISHQTKEGKMMIDGVQIHNSTPNPLEDLPSGMGIFGYTSGLIAPKHDVVKCHIDPFGNESHLEKIHYTGKGGILNQQTKTITPLEPEEAEDEIPGFQFVNGPCNPCKVFDSPSDYSCPFVLNLPKSNSKSNITRYGISDVWKYLWNQ
jgi:hypothetical protein